MRSVALLTTIALATSALAAEHISPHHRLNKRGLERAERWSRRRRGAAVEPAGALKLAVVAPSAETDSTSSSASTPSGAKAAVAPETLAAVEASIASTTTSAAKASPTPIKLSTPSYNTTAIWYAETGFVSACNTTITDDDEIIAIPMALWSNGAEISEFCGQSVVVTNPATGAQVTLKVASTSSRVDYTIMTEKSFIALGGSPVVGELPVTFQFVRGTIAQVAVQQVRIYSTSSSEAAVSSSKAAVADAKSSSIASASSSASAYSAAVTAQADAKASSKAAAAASATEAAQSASAAAAESKASVEAAAKTTTTTTTDKPEPTTTDKPEPTTTDKPEPTTTDKPEPKPTVDAAKSASVESVKLAVQFSSSKAAAAAAQAEETTTTKAPAPSPSPSSGGGENGGGSGQVYKGGFATFYTQNGVAGNCGTVSQDSDKVIALPTQMYANGAHCGKFITLTRVSNGAQVTAKVMDSCPTCVNNNSLDLSVAAFTQIATEEEGMVAITWQWA